MLIGESLCKGSGTELEDIAWSQFPGPRGGLSDTAILEINPGRTQTVGGFRVRFSTEYQEVDPERSVRLPQSLEGKTILLRTLASGDRFANEKRVDDWLRIHRVPVIIRSKLVCLVDEDTEWVIWIPGLPMPSPNDSVTSRDSIVVLWETNSDT